MTQTPATEIVFTFNDVAILFDRETGMGSLTGMWRAKGATPHRQPGQWLRTQTAQDLIAALEARLNMHICIVETREGNAGGTWAHWQIAAAYAHYLDPAFYLQWNEWAVAHLTQRPALPALPAPTIEGLTQQVAQLSIAVAQLRATAAQAGRGRVRGLTPEAQQVIDAMSGLAVAVSPAHVTRLLAAMGVALPTHTVRVRMMRMEAAGLLMRAGHGLYLVTPAE